MHTGEVIDSLGAIALEVSDKYGVGGYVLALRHNGEYVVWAWNKTKIKSKQPATDGYSLFSGRYTNNLEKAIEIFKNRANIKDEPSMRSWEANIDVVMIVEAETEADAIRQMESQLADTVHDFGDIKVS